MAGRWVIFDGHYLLHRALWAMVKEERPTDRALANILIQMAKTLNQFRARGALVVFEGARVSERRRALFPGYKAARQKREQDPEMTEFRRVFFDHRRVLLGLLPALGIRSIRLVGREGDDVIALLCGLLLTINPSSQIMIESEDRDLAQLICPQVVLYRSRSGELVTWHDFEAAIGVRPAWFLLGKAIVGDSSDGIPGIPGVGWKTVQGLARRYQRLTVEDLVKACSGASRQRERSISQGSHVLERNLELMDLSQEIFGKPEIREVCGALEDSLTVTPASISKALDGAGHASVFPSVALFGSVFAGLSGVNA